MRSASDNRVFEYANKNGLVLVTRDLGFGNLFIVNGGFGLLLSRLPFYFKSQEINMVFDLFLKEVDVKGLVNSITVLELSRYRVRKL